MNTKKITIKGSGGHGVKLLMSILAKLLADTKKLTLVFDYDSAVRGGFINGNLIISDEKIASPIIDKADIIADMIEANVEIKGKKQEINIEEIKKDAENFVLNMFYLGLVMNLIEVELNSEKIKEILGKKYSEANMQSIELGYQYKI